MRGAGAPPEVVIRKEVVLRGAWGQVRGAWGQVLGAGRRGGEAPGAPRVLWLLLLVVRVGEPCSPAPRVVTAPAPGPNREREHRRAAHPACA